MNSKLLNILRFPLAALMAFAFLRCSDNKAAVNPPAEDPIPVKLEQVVRGDQGRVLQYSGLIASDDEARLSFKIGGIISRIYVKEGDHVAAGQLLATLDLTEIEAQVKQARENLEKTQRDEHRIGNLYRDTVASLEQLQNSHTQATVASETLRIAEFNRQYAQIRATSSGTILQKIGNEGEYVAAGGAVFQFNATENNDWVVRFGVSDRDWAVLRKGEKAAVTIDAYPDQHFSGVITRLAESADAGNGTYPIEVTILPAGHKLALGLFCTIRLQPSADRSFAFIPASALAEGEGSTGYVFVLNNDRRTVRKMPVRIAYLQGDRLAVSSGLDSIREVIADGVGYLTERSVVTPVTGIRSTTK
jgi:multidrug efflux system membrane fusion protein